MPSLTVSLSRSVRMRSAARPSSAARAVAAAWRICMPPICTDRLPKVGPWSGVSRVSPCTTSTLDIGTESSSAAICAIAVRTPVPRSTLPE